MPSIRKAFFVLDPLWLRLNYYLNYKQCTFGLPGQFSTSCY